ncbi:hypothetical protein AX16_003353 [Volvariella volvacea WC 439]|nr:hypothetical protein AX16_003353 [Volvariella volvacea WC 439]
MRSYSRHRSPSLPMHAAPTHEDPQPASFSAVSPPFPHMNSPNSHSRGSSNMIHPTTTSYPPLSRTLSSHTVNSSTTKTVEIDLRDTIRTPSPTPSEARALKSGVIDWKSITNWRFWFRREWLWYYVALVIIVVVSALVTFYHEQIVDWLTPATRWLHDLSFGWLVPIAVLFIISFPPLFGHEIVGVLCGLVWGLWIGFGIVAAGTFLGEVGNFYAFKYCCSARGEKLERTQIRYACLARVVREGGFRIALAARLSAIPGHFTTAVFSTCGMNIFVFSLAAILSLPKQFIVVYLGVILDESKNGQTDSKSRIITNVVLAITLVITALAMWYILREMNRVKPDVIYQRRKARQSKLPKTEYTYTKWHPGSTDHLISQDQHDVEAYAYAKDTTRTSTNTLASVESASTSSTLVPVYAPKPKHPPLSLSAGNNILASYDRAEEGEFVGGQRVSANSTLTHGQLAIPRPTPTPPVLGRSRGDAGAGAGVGRDGGPLPMPSTGSDLEVRLQPYLTSTSGSGSGSGSGMGLSSSGGGGGVSSPLARPGSSAARGVYHDPFAERGTGESASGARMERPSYSR